MKLDKRAITKFIKAALAEDVGDGDHTSLATVPAEATGKAKLLLKDEGTLAGVELAKMIFKIVDKDLKVKVLIKDGNGGHDFIELALNLDTTIGVNGLQIAF